MTRFHPWVRTLALLTVQTVVLSTTNVSAAVSGLPQTYRPRAADSSGSGSQFGEEILTTMLQRDGVPAAVAKELVAVTSVPTIPPTKRHLVLASVATYVLDGTVSTAALRAQLGPEGVDLGDAQVSALVTAADRLRAGGSATVATAAPLGLGAAPHRFELRDPIVRPFDQPGLRVAVVVNPAAFAEDGASTVGFDRVTNQLTRNGQPVGWDQAGAVFGLRQSAADLARGYEAAHPGQEVVAILPTSNLGLYKGYVTAMVDETGAVTVYHQPGEPLDDRPYDVLVTRRDGTVAAMTVRFVNEEGERGIFDERGVEDLSGGIRAALAAPRIVKDGQVNLEAIVDRFDDLRHVLRLPYVELGREQIHLGFNDGTGELFTNRDAILQAVRGEPVTLSLEPLTRRGITPEQIRETVAAWGYSEEAGVAEMASLAEGDFQLDAEAGTLTIVFRPGIHPHSLIGVRQDGTLLAGVVPGRTHEVGATIEGLAQDLVAQGAWNAFIVGNGKDTFLQVGEEKPLAAEGAQGLGFQAVLLVRDRTPAVDDTVATASAGDVERWMTEVQSEDAAVRIAAAEALAGFMLSGERFPELRSGWTQELVTALRQRPDAQEVFLRGMQRASRAAQARNDEMIIKQMPGNEPIAFARRRDLIVNPGILQAQLNPLIPKETVEFTITPADAPASTDRIRLNLEQVMFKAPPFPAVPPLVIAPAEGFKALSVTFSQEAARGTVRVVAQTARERLAPVANEALRAAQARNDGRASVQAANTQLLFEEVADTLEQAERADGTLDPKKVAAARKTLQKAGAALKQLGTERSELALIVLQLRALDAVTRAATPAGEGQTPGSETVATASARELLDQFEGAVARFQGETLDQWLASGVDPDASLVELIDRQQELAHGDQLRLISALKGYAVALSELRPFVEQVGLGLAPGVAETPVEDIVQEAQDRGEEEALRRAMGGTIPEGLTGSLREVVQRGFDRGEELAILVLVGSIIEGRGAGAEDRDARARVEAAVAVLRDPAVRELATGAARRLVARGGPTPLLREAGWIALDALGEARPGGADGTVATASAEEFLDALGSRVAQLRTAWDRGVAQEVSRDLTAAMLQWDSLPSENWARLVSVAGEFARLVAAQPAGSPEEAQELEWQMDEAVWALVGVVVQEELRWGERAGQYAFTQMVVEETERIGPPALAALARFLDPQARSLGRSGAVRMVSRLVELGYEPVVGLRPALAAASQDAAVTDSEAELFADVLQGLDWMETHAAVDRDLVAVAERQQLPENFLAFSLEEEQERGGDKEPPAEGTVATAAVEAGAQDLARLAVAETRLAQAPDRDTYVNTLLGLTADWWNHPSPEVRNAVLALVSRPIPTAFSVAADGTVSTAGRERVSDEEILAAYRAWQAGQPAGLRPTRRQLVDAMILEVYRELQQRTGSPPSVDELAQQLAALEAEPPTQAGETTPEGGATVATAAVGQERGVLEQVAGDLIMVQSVLEQAIEARPQTAAGIVQGFDERMIQASTALGEAQSLLRLALGESGPVNGFLVWEARDQFLEVGKTLEGWLPGVATSEEYRRARAALDEVTVDRLAVRDAWSPTVDTIRAVEREVGKLHPRVERLDRRWGFGEKWGVGIELRNAARSLRRAHEKPGHVDGDGVWDGAQALWQAAEELDGMGTRKTRGFSERLRAASRRLYAVAVAATTPLEGGTVMTAAVSGPSETVATAALGGEASGLPAHERLFLRFDEGLAAVDEAAQSGWWGRTGRLRQAFEAMQLGVVGLEGVAVSSDERASMRAVQRLDRLARRTQDAVDALEGRWGQRAVALRGVLEFQLGALAMSFRQIALPMARVPTYLELAQQGTLTAAFEPILEEVPTTPAQQEAVAALRRLGPRGVEALARDATNPYRQELAALARQEREPAAPAADPAGGGEELDPELDLEPYLPSPSADRRSQLFDLPEEADEPPTSADQRLNWAVGSFEMSRMQSALALVLLAPADAELRDRLSAAQQEAQWESPRVAAALGHAVVAVEQRLAAREVTSGEIEIEILPEDVLLNLDELQKELGSDEPPSPGTPPAGSGGTVATAQALPPEAFRQAAARVLRHTQALVSSVAGSGPRLSVSEEAVNGMAADLAALLPALEAEDAEQRGNAIRFMQEFGEAVGRFSASSGKLVARPPRDATIAAKRAYFIASRGELVAPTRDAPIEAQRAFFVASALALAHLTPGPNTETEARELPSVAASPEKSLLEGLRALQPASRETLVGLLRPQQDRRLRIAGARVLGLLEGSAWPDRPALVAAYEGEEDPEVQLEMGLALERLEAARGLDRAIGENIAQQRRDTLQLPGFSLDEGTPDAGGEGTVATAGVAPDEWQRDVADARAALRGLEADVVNLRRESWEGAEQAEPKAGEDISLTLLSMKLLSTGIVLMNLEQVATKGSDQAGRVQAIQVAQAYGVVFTTLAEFVGPEGGEGASPAPVEDVQTLSSQIRSLQDSVVLVLAEARQAHPRDEAVQRAVLSAFGQLGQPAKDSLVRLLGPNAPVSQRLAVAGTLGALGAAVEELRPDLAVVLSNEPDAQVQDALGDALEQIASEAAGMRQLDEVDTREDEAGGAGGATVAQALPVPPGVIARLAAEIAVAPQRATIEIPAEGREALARFDRSAKTYLGQVGQEFWPAAIGEDTYLILLGADDLADGPGVLQGVEEYLRRAAEVAAAAGTRPRAQFALLFQQATSREEAEQRRRAVVAVHNRLVAGADLDEAMFPAVLYGRSPAHLAAQVAALEQEFGPVKGVIAGAKTLQLLALSLGTLQEMVRVVLGVGDQRRYAARAVAVYGMAEAMVAKGYVIPAQILRRFQGVTQDPVDRRQLTIQPEPVEARTDWRELYRLAYEASL